MEFKQESLQTIISNPRAWAQEVAEKELVKHLDKYKQAKVLGEQFAKEISNED